MATQPSYSPEPAPVTRADELAVIVQRAQTFTNASGAATAIREPNTNEIICRARSGASAPAVGTVLRTEGTFTGMCIRNGEELLCDDAQTDGRVDTSAIRALGVRSIAVAPIKEDGGVIGVLAVFAPAAYAFSALHVAMLNAWADQISMLLRKERRSKTARYTEPPVSRPGSSVRADASSQFFSKGPVASVASDTEASASTPAFERGTPEADTNQAAGAGIVSPILIPEQIERHKEKPTESTVLDCDSRIRELRLASASRQKRTNSIRKKFIIAGPIAAVLVAGFVIVVLLKIGNWRSDGPAPGASRENSSSVQTESKQNASYPGPALSTAGSNARPHKVASGSQSQSKRSQRPGGAKPVPVATLTPSDSKIVMRSGSSGNESQDVVPGPSLSVSSVSSTPDLSWLARPARTTVPGTGFHSDLVNAKAIRIVRAIYPETARKSHTSGRVILGVTVRKDGKVTKPKFISGPAIFRNAAFDAVKQWLFKPAMLNGESIEQETEITMNFNP